MEMRLPYGKGTRSVSLSDEWSVTSLNPKRRRPLADPLGEVEGALSRLSSDLKARLAQADSVVIAVNDKTRPVPHNILVPPLVHFLKRLGVADERIVFIVASGGHPPMERSEYPSILPVSICEEYAVASHDALKTSELVTLGKTRRGTPACFNHRLVDADVRIVVGNIEPHQFVGFSGGVKSAVIGLAGLETISHNHAMMTELGSRLGEYDDNPVRQDIEELGRLLGIDLAVNVVLNDEKQVVAVICDDPEEVMRRGIPIVRELFEVQTDGPFDMTIASPGGYPKDINLYQAQKALAHAALVTREGGVIVLVAECPEGAGSADYEDWVRTCSSHEEVISRFKEEGFRIGPHKAFQISRDAVGRKVYLVSGMDDTLTRQLLLTPVATLDEALALASEAMVGVMPMRVAMMPYANATIPVLTRNGREESSGGERR